MALSVKVEKKCVTEFDADKIFIIDTDKHYFSSKLTTDMSVYVRPTYTMYVGITLFQCYLSNMFYRGPTSKLTLGQRYFTTLAQRSD